MRHAVTIMVSLAAVQAGCAAIAVAAVTALE